MSKTGLKRRLLESHLIIAFAGIFVILVLCVVAVIVGRSGAKLFESTGPIPNSSLSLINSLQASIAANHGWVYLGNRKFILENKVAWEKIDTGLQNFQDAVEANTEIVSEAKLEEISDSITRLRKLQAGIVYLPSSSERSSVDIYTINIEPLEIEINELLTSLEATALLEQRAVLSIEKYLTETALQLELSIKSREYIDSQKYQRARDNLMLSTIPVAHRIAIDGLDSEHVLQKLSHAIRTFLEKTDQASVSHQVESNNQVRQFLFEHAVPLSNGIIGILQNVVSRAQDQVELRRETIKQVSIISLIGAIVALLALIISAIVLSMNNANKLLTRLTSLADAVEGLSESASYKAIAVDGDDEISHLADLFNVMALAIKEKQNSLRSHQNELENRVVRRTRELFGAKEFAETTLRSVGDALITIDSDLFISMFNPAAERLLGVSADRAVGQPLASVIVLLRCDELVFDLTNAIAESMEAKQLLSPDETLSLQLADKTAVPVKMSLAPIADMKANKAGSILILRNVEREIKLQSELSYQANHDLLTGLRNRASFNAEMDNLLQNGEDMGHTHVLAFLDLDKFKVVNDSCGHAAGDELLKQISRLLSSNLRTGDMLARLGGDEFAIMLRDCDITNGETTALDLRDCVANHRFSWDGRVFSVGVSIGITECKPGAAVLKDILTEADLACYEAKAAGRNKVRVSKFSKASVETEDNTVLSQENLLYALQKETPCLVLQDKIGTIVSGRGPLYEPRLEFLDDQGLEISEHTIRSAIERAGLFSAYDGCLLSKSLSLAASNQASVESEPLGLLVRLSEALFNDDALFDQLSSDLEQNSLMRDTLYFCYSEHSVLKNLESARTKLDVLARCGVRTILEDFNGSFSSLASIRGISIDYLQIDQALVNDILLNPEHQIMVGAICELANVSGKQTIVTGAFDANNSAVLINLGVNVILPDSSKQELLRDVTVLADKPSLVKAG